MEEMNIKYDLEVTLEESRWKESFIPTGVSASCAPDLAVQRPYGLSACP